MVESVLTKVLVGGYCQEYAGNGELGLKRSAYIARQKDSRVLPAIGEVQELMGLNARAI
jgi:hypothetical protein